MASSFSEAFDERYQAIQQSRVGSGAYGQDYKVADLVAVYGSKQELQRAYAQKYGVQYGSANKALTRLERFERGETGGDVRKGTALVQERLNELGRERVGNNIPETPGVSGMSGGVVDVVGTVAIGGNWGDPDYEEEREVNAWPLTSQQADELAIVSHEQGEAQAGELFMQFYGQDSTYAFQNSGFAASEVVFQTVGW